MVAIRKVKTKKLTRTKISSGTLVGRMSECDATDWNPDSQLLISIQFWIKPSTNFARPCEEFGGRWQRGWNHFLDPKWDVMLRGSQITLVWQRSRLSKNHLLQLDLSPYISHQFFRGIWYTQHRDYHWFSKQLSIFSIDLRDSSMYPRDDALNDILSDIILECHQGGGR